MNEPRTNGQIMADLLELVINDEWSGQSNMSCHCHPNYVPCCPQCEVLQYPHDSYRGQAGEHKPDCKRAALIRETRALLRVENEQAEARGDDTVWIP